MAAQKVFKRYELKYVLTVAQYHELLELMKNYMIQDEYGKYRIHNIYMDTDDYLLIRHSIEKPCYKEKMRIRAYGDVTKDSQLFIEIKKKYDGIVYKRRVDLPLTEVYDYIYRHKPLKGETQITKEIDYFMNYYEGLAPKILLSYDREAFKGMEDSEFRMTFDQNIMVQEEEVCFLHEHPDKKVLSEDMVVLEVKTGLGMPSWLLHFFSENKIYRRSFSKYGTAYKKFFLQKKLGGSTDVA